MNAAGTLRTTLVVLLASASIQPLAAQNSQVDGQVRNRLGYGIPGVEIHVLESGARVVTDNATFVLLPVPAALAEGEAVPPGGVVPRDTPAGRVQYERYFRRTEAAGAEASAGAVITRDQVARLNARTTIDLLREVPGSSPSRGADSSRAASPSPGAR